MNFSSIYWNDVTLTHALFECILHLIMNDTKVDITSPDIYMANLTHWETKSGYLGHFLIIFSQWKAEYDVTHLLLVSCLFEDQKTKTG